MLQHEGLVAYGDCIGGGQRRSLSLWDHMSAVENTNRDPLAGLTLDAILTSDKRATSAMAPSPAPPAQVSRTLLDIIRDEEPHGSLFGHKDKKSWKAFRDRLRLKRAGAAWTSSVPIPTSDIPIQNSNSGNPNSVRFNNSRSLMSRRNSVRFTTVSSVPTPSEEDSNADTSASVTTSRPVMSRRTSTRYSSNPPPAPDTAESEEADIHAPGELPAPRSIRPQMSRHNSTRVPATNVEASEECDEEPVAQEGTRRLATVLAEERAMSAREAVAAQEAAEAEAAAQAAAEAAAAAEESEEGAEAWEEGAVEAQPVRMSLMDLLEETDRQMGFVGMTYSMGEDEEYEEEEEEEEEEDGGGASSGGRVEHTCCVCMVRHKGAAFIPCGHTFCRLCSRELWVQRGNCPLCNGFIVEILDIF